MTKASGESIDGTASRRIADTEGKPICRINVYPNVKKNHCHFHDAGSSMQSSSTGRQTGPARCGAILRALGNDSFRAVNFMLLSQYTTSISAIFHFVDG